MPNEKLTRQQDIDIDGSNNKKCTAFVSPANLPASITMKNGMTILVMLHDHLHLHYSAKS